MIQISTYWFFECLDHDPPIRSRDEFTQHTEDLNWERAMQLVGERPVERDDSYWTTTHLPGQNDAQVVDAYFEMNARAFLHEHPSCRLGVVNEYGERRQL